MVTTSYANKYFLLCLMLCTYSSASAQILYDINILNARREEVRQGKHSEALKALVKEANIYLYDSAASVMQKHHMPPSGDKHDFCSLAVYAWPDSTKTNGIPYVFRDGYENPMHREYDTENLKKLLRKMRTLTLTWFFTGEERYAERAIELLKVWFLNPETAMNPNMNYCEICPGRNGGMGYNIISGIEIASMLDWVVMLENDGWLAGNDQKRFHEWIETFWHNIEESPSGQKNETYTNNFAENYDIQMLYYMTYCGKKKTAKRYAKSFPKRRLSIQLNADGSFAQEITRTRSYTYSWKNLIYLVDIMLIARNLGVNISHMKAKNGATITDAINYLTPYIGAEREKWPHQEVTSWSAIQGEAKKEMHRISHVMEGDFDAKKAQVPPTDIYNLLW